MNITIPSSIEDATERLEGIESLLTAKGWERAAIVAAFVRLSDVQGRHVSSDMMTPVEFAALGIAGLKSKNTVRLYVQRWLDAHDDIYPEPGAEVEIPDIEWPPTRTGTDGYSSSEGAADTVRKVVEKHGAEVLDEALDFADDEVRVTVARKVVKEAGRDYADQAKKMREEREEREDQKAKQRKIDSKERLNRSGNFGQGPRPTDIATDHLRSAAGELAEAIVWGEEFGIEYPDTYQEALDQVGRYFRVLTAPGTDDLTDDDRDFLDEIGATL